MFENKNPEDRAKLIEKLQAKGLPAFEFDSGSGMIRVVVPLLRRSEHGLEINAQYSEMRADLNVPLNTIHTIHTCSLPQIVCERHVRLV